ncbi:putative N6-adenine methyltransferase-domain-containing protein [Myxozyma melibiosi]|uniref:Protein-lysine N-methyltransferase EFM5 n=1 Tax=Myxozyma melibiosi TaxID=54550 RepID=A0ABR1FE81_9ASCO
MSEGDRTEYSKIEEEDDDLKLPADTLALLQDFQQTQSSKLAMFEKMQKRAEARFDAIGTDGFSFDDEEVEKAEDDDDGEGEGEDEEGEGEEALKSMEIFTEDWNLSQFWYTDETAHRLSAYLLEPLVKLGKYGSDDYETVEGYESKDDLRIAILSAPTVHQYLTRVILPKLPKGVSKKVHAVVFEHDTRFAVFGPKQFVHYDFNAPMRIPAAVKERFDSVLVDPPFLSEECQVKTAITVRLLLRKPSEEDAAKGRSRPRVAVCTGQKVADVILRTYRGYGVRCTDFRPEHRNGLQNEFRCFASEAVEGVWGFEE